MARPPGCTAKQTKKRIAIVDGVMNGLTSREMYRVIGNGRDEASVTDYMHQTLLESLRKTYLVLNPEATPQRADKWARSALL